MDYEQSASSKRPKASDGVGKRLAIIGIFGVLVLSGAGFWRWWSGGAPEDIKAKYGSFYKPPKGYDANQAAIKQTATPKKPAKGDASKKSSDDSGAEKAKDSADKPGGDKP